jgi:hypothetical protein
VEQSVCADRLHHSLPPQLAFFLDLFVAFSCKNSQSPSTKFCKLLVCNLNYPIDAKLEVPTT